MSNIFAGVFLCGHLEAHALEHRILFLKYIDFAIDVLRAVNDGTERIDHGLMANIARGERKRIVPGRRQSMT